MMIRAKKSFGQNWLVDTSVITKIITASEITPGEVVVEVGPGTGLLTHALVSAGAKVIAIEADESLIESLQEQFGDKITLIEADALTVDLPTQPYKLIANIPYNITSDLLRRFLTYPSKPTRMVLMVQKEVAVRITARPPMMSLLSVMCQVYAQCRRVTNVPAGAFRPIPKVDSAVVQLDVFDAQEQWGIDPEEVIALAKVGFSSRRKQLHGLLAGVSGITSQQVKDVLLTLGLDPRARAEELSVENWVKLTHTLHKK